MRYELGSAWKQNIMALILIVSVNNERGTFPVASNTQTI
jgi:hypothetical protein